MPFLGTLPASVRSILADEVARWKVQHLHFPCSGRYTVARGMADLGLKLYGNDVTLYSCALGAFYAGTPFPVQLVDEEGELGWMEPFMADQEAQIASVIVWSEMAMPWAKRGSNAYYARLAAGFRSQYQRLHDDVRRKMGAAKMKLAGFWAGDCVEYVRGIPPEHGIITFPPVYVGGYEVMWKYLEKRFTWQVPEYPMFDEGSMKALIGLLADRPAWVVGAQGPIPGLEANFIGQVHETDRGTLFTVYASRPERTRLVTPHQKLEPLMTPHLGPGDELAGPLSLRPLSAGEFNAIRAKYLNPNIAPGSAAFAVAILAGGKIVGVLAASPGDQVWSGVEKPMLYLFSDFPVAPTRYPRLSKLVVMAALSREFRMLAERACNCRFRSLGTTAFTTKPVSMKYRGLLDLMKRAPAEAADKARGFEWKLGYAAPLGRWTLDEALAEWKRRFDKPGGEQ